MPRGTLGLLTAGVVNLWIPWRGGILAIMIGIGGVIVLLKGRKKKVR